MSRPKRKDDEAELVNSEPVNPEMVKQIQKLLEMTAPKEAVQLQRYGSMTNGVIERYKELHAEIEKLLEF